MADFSNAQQQLMAVPDDILDTWVASGSLGQGAANEIKARRYAEAQRAPLEAQADVQNTAMAQTPAGMQQAQQGSDVITEQALQGTGITPTFPAIQSPGQGMMAPDAVQGLPSTLEAPVSSVAPMVPSEEQVAAEMQAAQGAMAQQKASQVMAAQAASEEQEKADRAMAKAAQEEEEVTQDLKGTSWASDLGQAAAIMLGAYSQMYTGAKENPAVVAIDKKLDRLAAEKKYSEEKRLRLSDQAYKQAQLELEKKKATIDNMATLRRLEQADQELALKRGEVQAKLQERALLSQTRFTKEQAARLPADMREKLNLVRLPDGSAASAFSSKQAADLGTLNTDTDSALMSAGQLMNKIEYFGNNPVKKFVDRESAGQVKGLATALKGQLRLPYLGPGAMTDSEREMLDEIIGDPTVIFSVESANRAKLQTIIDKVKFFHRSAMRSGGIDLPLSENEKLFKEYKAARPNLSDGQIVNNLKSAGKWKPE